MPGGALPNPGSAELRTGQDPFSPPRPEQLLAQSRPLLSRGQRGAGPTLSWPGRAGAAATAGGAGGSGAERAACARSGAAAQRGAEWGGPGAAPGAAGGSGRPCPAPTAQRCSDPAQPERERLVRDRAGAGPSPLHPRWGRAPIALLRSPTCSRVPAWGQCGLVRRCSELAPQSISAGAGCGWAGAACARLRATPAHSGQQQQPGFRPVSCSWHGAGRGQAMGCSSCEAGRKCAQENWQHRAEALLAATSEQKAQLGKKRLPGQVAPFTQLRSHHSVEALGGEGASGAFPAWLGDGETCFAFQRTQDLPLASTPLDPAASSSRRKPKPLGFTQS